MRSSCAGDVTVAADCQALVAKTVEAFGHLDFAHNNAGVELQDDDRRHRGGRLGAA